MRIVGGMWRGRAFDAPEGRGTRPTTDRMRESVASMVLSAFDLDLSDVAVLDAFAGSGAIGFELLSRGAKSCTFVERDRRAAGVVKANAKLLGAMAGMAQVQVGDVCSLAERGVVMGGPFGLLVLDPPYAMDALQVSRLVSDLRDKGQLSPDAVVLYEHARGSSDLALADARLLKLKNKGSTTLSLFKLQPGGQPE